MNAIGINKWLMNAASKEFFHLFLCLLTVFGVPSIASGQTTETKTISLSKLFTSADFKGAPTVTKTVDGFTIILDNASWDATHQAVKISDGAITINGQQKTDTQKAYLFNQIVFDKLGTFNQKQVDSIIPNRGSLTANASNPEEVTWKMDNGDIAVPGYNHSLRMTVKGDLYLDNTAGSMTVSYIESDVKTPYIRLSGSYFEQSILQKTFRKTPTYAIYGDPEMKQNITSDFSVNFYFGKAADLTDDAIQTTDAVTGSVVTKLYGRVTIGDTPGDAIVMIRATPYDNIYNTVYGAYMIHIPKMQPQVTFSQDTIKAYLGTEIAMPKVAIGDGAGNNITSNYTVAVEAKAVRGSTAPEGTLFSYVDNTKQQIIRLKSEGSFAFHYTFTPTNATKFNSYQQDVPVTIIKPSGIIPTTTSFPHEEHTIKLTDTQVKLDTAIVRDDLGNDVTSCFIIKLIKKSDPNNICGNLWTSSNRANDWTMQTNGTVQGTVVFNVTATPDNAWGHDYSTIFTGSSSTLSYSTATRHARLIVSPNIFTTYINGYIGEDNQPTLQNNYEGAEVSGEYLVRVPLSAEPSATTYKNTFNPDSIVTDKNGVKWACYNYTKLKYNKSASNWRLSFGKAVSNTDIIFVFHPWDQTHYGDVSAVMHLTVLDKITPRLTFSSDSCVANVGKPFEEPTLTITDANGKDISSHFTLNYTIEQHDGSKATIDASTGRVNIGDDQSYAIITVTATPKTTDDAEVYNNGSASYYLRIWYKSDATWNYQITEGEDTYYYNYDDTSGEVSVTPSDAGLLTFTASGKMEAGTSIAGVPGLVITFGKEGEKSFTVTDNSDHTFYAVSKEVKFSGSDLVTPTGGTFYQLQPKVNGYVTVKANYLKDNVVVLRWVKEDGTYEDDEHVATADGVASHTFRYPLFAGQTYYLFNMGNGSSNDGLELYGLNYQPAWLMTRYDTKGYTRTKIYIGSYTGHLPYLMTQANKNVTFSTEYAQETDAQKEKKPEYLVVGANSRITINSAANVDKTAIDTHPLVNNPGIGVLASVSSPETKADGSSKAVKHAIMAVRLSGLPVYIVQEGETPYVGKVVTTTPKTNITMTYGGWSNYYLANPQKGTYGIDSWKVAKMDSVGANDRIFAGFPDYTGGGMNAKHENVYRNTGNYLPSAPSTWDVPCRGAYVKFEPTSNGRLNVYILQNGCCQYSGNPRDIDPNVDGSYSVKVKWTPYYLVDETGKPVDFTEENGTSNAIALEEEDLNSLGPATKGIYRANYNGEKVGSQTINWDFSDMGPETKNDPALAEQRKAYIIDNWKSQTKGERETVFSNTEGAHQIISKAYVRYTFDVQAGKTYFLFSNVSKIGLCGFSFSEDEHQNTPEVDLPEKGEAQPETYAGTFVKVKVPNNYTKGKWSSLCVPFSMNERQFKQTFGRRARLIAFDDLRNDSVLFTRHFYQFVVAGRPYFIYPDTTLTDGFTVDSVYMGKQAKPDDYFLKAPANSYYIAKGLFATAKLNQGSLVVVGSNGKQDGGGKLYTVGSEPANLSAYHAYVDFTGTTSSTGAKAFFTSYDGKEHGSIGGSGTATSIEGITELSTEGNKKATTSQGDGRVYSLSGQCVGESPEALTRLPKGVYIVNGKKVIVR
jgi:hypothetical protein